MVTVSRLTGITSAAFAVSLLFSAQSPSAQASGDKPASQPLQQAASPTFTKDVLPILQRSCQSCHRPGTPAPMSLLTYADARPWARSIRYHGRRRKVTAGREIVPQRSVNFPSLSVDKPRKTPVFWSFPWEAILHWDKVSRRPNEILNDCVRSGGGVWHSGDAGSGSRRGRKGCGGLCGAEMCDVSHPRRQGHGQRPAGRRRQQADRGRNP